MKIGIILTGAILSFTTAVVLAQGDQTPAPSPSPDEQRFRGNELSVDAFGGLTLGQYNLDHFSRYEVRHNGRLDAGAGANYFFTPYLGIGGDGYTENTRHSFVDDASGSLILRLPLQHIGIAPYIFGGAGHVFDPAPATSGHGGVGLDFRISPHFGLFADARYVVTDRVGNYGLGRFGVRLVF
jgi:hypothetical protein